MLSLLVLKLSAAQGLPDLVASQFAQQKLPGVEFQEVALPDSAVAGEGPLVEMDGPFIVEEDEPMIFGGFGPDVFGPEIGGPAHSLPPSLAGMLGPPLPHPSWGSAPSQAGLKTTGNDGELLAGLFNPQAGLQVAGSVGSAGGAPAELAGLPDGVSVVIANMDPPRPRFRGSRRGPGPIGGTLEMHISQRALPIQELTGAFGGLFNPLMVPLHHDKPAEKQNASEKPTPKNAFDAFIHDVIGEMGLKVGDMQKASVAPGGGAPPACRNETKKYCADAHPHVMHCLANHSADLGAGCKATVKKSLPAVCKAVIKKSCDTLEEGVLPCLKRLDGAKKLSGTCADSFHATMQSIARVKDGLSYGATVVNQLTGIERPLVGPAEADSYYDRFRNFAGSLLEPDW